MPVCCWFSHCPLQKSMFKLQFNFNTKDMSKNHLQVMWLSCLNGSNVFSFIDGVSFSVSHRKTKEKTISKFLGRSFCAWGKVCLSQLHFTFHVIFWGVDSPIFHKGVLYECRKIWCARRNKGHPPSHPTRKFWTLQGSKRTKSRYLIRFSTPKGRGAEAL